MIFEKYTQRNLSHLLINTINVWLLLGFTRNMFDQVTTFFPKNLSKYVLISLQQHNTKLCFSIPPKLRGNVIHPLSFNIFKNVIWNGNLSVGETYRLTVQYESMVLKLHKSFSLHLAFNWMVAADKGGDCVQCYAFSSGWCHTLSEINLSLSLVIFK